MYNKGQLVRKGKEVGREEDNLVMGKKYEGKDQTSHSRRNTKTLPR